jgi:hypothetical protein
VGALLSGSVAAAGFGLAAGPAQADPDHCSSRSGCYHGPGMRWCPGDYVWPGSRATGGTWASVTFTTRNALPGTSAVAPTRLPRGRVLLPGLFRLNPGRAHLLHGCVRKLQG